MSDEDSRQVDNQENRRTHDRSRLIIDVFFDGKDVTGIASTNDISVGGFYMNPSALLPDGAALLVRIPLRDGRELVCNAEVADSNPGHGVGIRFQELSDEARTLIENELENVE
jgi:hypothetical protein